MTLPFARPGGIDVPDKEKELGMASSEICSR